MKILKTILGTMMGVILGLTIFFVLLVRSCTSGCNPPDNERPAKFEYLEQQKREEQKQEELRRKNAPGSSYCRYAIENRIRDIGGTHTGIEYKGEGKFIAFVANSTTNYNYKVTHFYTNADCEIINVVVR